MSIHSLTKASYCHPRLKKALNYAIINKSKIERMSPMKNFRDDIKVNDLAQPFLEPIVEKMTTVFDPEIELDIYNLGLIYEITVDENGTATSLCPLLLLLLAVKRLCLMKSLKS